MCTGTCVCLENTWSQPLGNLQDFEGGKGGGGGVCFLDTNICNYAILALYLEWHYFWEKGEDSGTIEKI